MFNANKTAFIVFGLNSSKANKNPLFPINILGTSLFLADSVRNLSGPMHILYSYQEGMCQVLCSDE